MDGAEPDLIDEAQRARMARVKARVPMICTPVYRDCAWQYTRALANTIIAFERLGMNHAEHFMVGSSNLPKARNQLAAFFLASTCTDLLFIDADMGWRPNDVLRLLASDQLVVGAVGKKRVDEAGSNPKVWCARLLPDAAERLNQDLLGAVEVEAIGTGFLKIERTAFETIIRVRPDLRRAGDADLPAAVREVYHRFFAFGDNESGEDYGFCKMWRELGGSVWAAPEISLTHVGSREYTGSFAELLVPAEL